MLKQRNERKLKENLELLSYSLFNSSGTENEWMCDICIIGRKTN